jgi:hypothetical protein
LAAARSIHDLIAISHLVDDCPRSDREETKTKRLYPSLRGYEPSNTYEHRERWASSVCTAFSEYEEEAMGRLRELTRKRTAQERLDDPQLPLLQPVTKRQVLAELRRELAVDMTFKARLEALQPPDTEAGRRGRQLVETAVAHIDDNSSYVSRQLAEARETLSEHSTPWNTVGTLDRVRANVHADIAAALFADDVGAGNAASGTLIQAFYEADGCAGSWSTDIEVGEDAHLHSLARVRTCLQSNGRDRFMGSASAVVPGGARVLQMMLRIRDAPAAPHGAFRPFVDIAFYPTVDRARAGHDEWRRPGAWDSRRIDNIIYGRPPQVLGDVFEEVEECIQSS